MSAKILDGKLVSSVVRSSLKPKIDSMVCAGHRAPCLAVILIGSHPASQVYINYKRQACAELGIRSCLYSMADDSSEHEVLILLAELNADPQVDGILVQLPLPTQVRTSLIIENINPDKDVDGFHPINMGRLAQGHPEIRPCTPCGIMRLLAYYHLNISGLSALVIGASTIVGRPMALELLLAKATVTIAHSKTRNLEDYVRQSDLIVSATGVPNLVQVTWLHERQIIVDVGIHRDSNNRIQGDINFLQAQSRVAWITPVPGGVGPMTVSMLLENTVQCWLKAITPTLS